MSVVLTCETCGEGYESDDEESRYCSQECVYNRGKDRVTLECEECGDEYEKKPSHAERSRFCSRDCFHESRRDQVTSECAYCGEEHTRKRSKAEAYDHCSKACCYANRRTNKETLECENCGDEFEVWPSHVDRRRHCSYQCHADARDYYGENNMAWNGGVFHYGTGWKRRRKETLERDDYECQRCGTHDDDLDDSLHVHHIEKMGTFRDEDGDIDYERAHRLENLRTLCRDCHNAVEG